MISIHAPKLGQSAVCEPILRALPDWFGIEEANLMYIRDINVNPTFVAQADEKIVGFLTLMEHNQYSAEIHVMAVSPEWHRKGVGRELVHSAEDHLRRRNFEFLQVKTLSGKDPDEGYKKTRAFYLALGFRPLQEFDDLWGSENPCLQLVKSL
jgi:GNAT superfamily N-acetyltransferase